MKQLFTYLFFILLITGVWASSNKEVIEYEPLTYRFHTETEEYNTTTKIQVQPSLEILNIFKDKKNDKEHLYIFAEEYLNMGADTDKIPTEISEYINTIIYTNRNDIKHLIKVELDRAIEDNNVDKSIMVLGSTRIVCTIE